MIKIENQTANKNPLCEQQWSCCLMSGGKVSKHPCPLGSTGIPHWERSMQNYVPCSDFTRSSWKCEVCSPTASVYSPARWVNAFVTHFENLGYKDAFKKIAGFGRILERQAGIILKRSWPEPVPYPFQLTLRESPPYCSGSGPSYSPDTEGPDKNIRGFAIIPAVRLDLVTLLIPQHLFDLVVSSFRAGRSFRGGCRVEPYLQVITTKPNLTNNIKTMQK